MQRFFLFSIYITAINRTGASVPSPIFIGKTKVFAPIVYETNPAPCSRYSRNSS